MVHGASRSGDMDKDAVTIVTIQLVVSLLVMPITPVLWLCGAGSMSSAVQRFARMSPAVWTLFFSLLMHGAGGYFFGIVRVAIVPSDWFLTCLYSLLGALSVLVMAVGSYCLAILLRWGRQYQPQSLPIRTYPANRNSTAATADKPVQKTNGKHGSLKDDDRDDGDTPVVNGRISLHRVLQFIFPVAEAAFVELAWRVYLLPRLLNAIAPELALLCMSFLATLSILPIVLFCICVDVLVYPDTAKWSEEPMITRHPPTALSVLAYLLHMLVFNMLLGTVTMAANFCIWPAVCVSLYWEHVSGVVSGGMLISSYLPLGMEALFNARHTLVDQKIVPCGWLRGPPWKVSSEGLCGVFAMLPVLAVIMNYTVPFWTRDQLADLLPHGAIHTHT